MKKTTKKQEIVTDIVFLLDRSGSMYDALDDTIAGFNNYIDKMKKEKARVTTVLFDDRYEKIHDCVDIKDIKPLTREEYFTRGCTALLDAVGKTIHELDEKKREKVIFIITTDGLENASTKYSKKQIKEMIEGHFNFEFIYLGTGIDSFAEGGSIGIKSSNISNYKKSSRGIKSAFDSLCFASEEIMYKGNLSEDWKVEINKTLDE